MTGAWTTSRPFDADRAEGDLADEGEHRVAVVPGEAAVRVHQPRPRLRRSPRRALRTCLACCRRLGLLLESARRRRRLVERQVAGGGIEAEPGEAGAKMLGRLGDDLDPAAVGMVDPEAPGVEVELAADRAGQERLLAAIFAVADDRMADRRHVDAQLVGAAGERLELDPGGAVAGALDHPVAGARRLAAGDVDMHLLAAGARLLGDGEIDQAVLDRGHADDQRPIDLARGAAGKGLREESGGARRPGEQQDARRVLVEPVDELGPRRVRLDETVEQPIEMDLGLGPALGGEAGRLVDRRTPPDPRG